jgi:hypothetical protein
LNKSWVSGGKSSEAVERLRQQVSELEEKREQLLQKNKKMVFEWASYALGSPRAPRNLSDLRNEPEGRELRDVIALYDLLNQQIMDKEASLAEKLDEQARYDSLG